MGLVVCMLVKALERGRYQDTLQFETVRKLRSAFSNIWHTSRETLTTSVMARDLRKTYITSCPSYCLWFERFMFGTHKRIGDEVHQNQAISLEVIHMLVDDLEKEFSKSKDERKKEYLSDLAVFILAYFLAGLRGEETFKLLLGEQDII